MDSYLKIMDELARSVRELSTAGRLLYKTLRVADRSVVTYRAAGDGRSGDL